MQIEDAYNLVARSYAGEPGRFYEPGRRLALGKGCIYKNAAFPIYVVDESRYATAEGAVYVLTHECDVDEENNRLFNTDVLICPMMSLEEVVNDYPGGDGPLQGFLTNLGARNISRLAYFPPIADVHPYGSVLYLNQIASSPLELIRDKADLVCSLSGFGLREFEFILENHLLRVKADRLAFVPEPVELEQQPPEM